MFVYCVFVYHPKENIKYIDRYLNESYVWHVFYVSKYLCEFYYKEKVHYKIWKRFNTLGLMLMGMIVADSNKIALPKKC